MYGIVLVAKVLHYRLASGYVVTFFDSHCIRYRIESCLLLVVQLTNVIKVTGLEA